MTRSVFEFTRSELNRINVIADAIDYDEIEQLTANDIKLWGEWQAAQTRDEMTRLLNMQESLDEIAARKAESMDRAADALNRLADLAEKAGKDV